LSSRSSWSQTSSSGRSSFPGNDPRSRRPGFHARHSPCRGQAAGRAYIPVRCSRAGTRLVPEGRAGDRSHYRDRRVRSRRRTQR
jgi:hypothetical protein